MNNGIIIFSIEVPLLIVGNIIYIHNEFKLTDTFKPIRGHIDYQKAWEVTSKRLNGNFNHKTINDSGYFFVKIYLTDTGYAHILEQKFIKSIKGWERSMKIGKLLQKNTQLF